MKNQWKPMLLPLLGWALLVCYVEAGTSTIDLYKQFQEGRPLPKPVFELHHYGSDAPVDYTQFGEYVGVNTPDYLFRIKDMEALRAVCPEGVYPNENAVHESPRYKELSDKGQLGASHWAALGGGDLEKAFYIWAAVGEEPGVKAYFIGTILEKAGHILPALKAYHATFTHFSGSACFSETGTFVWYPSKSALGSMRRLCREYPELGLMYEGGSIDIKNGGDPDLSDDIITVVPGKFVKRSLAERKKTIQDPAKMEVKVTRGKGSVQLVQFDNGHWQMRKDGVPFPIRAVSYSPTRIGLGPKSDPHLFHTRWMNEDNDENGKIDVAYDSWVDVNRNGKQDDNEPATGDFQLMKEMGVNAIRFYHAPKPEGQYDSSHLNKPLLRKMAKDYGIYMILGDYLGAYTVGSGASWENGTDYRDEKQRARMKAIVKQMVLDMKDEPFVLMYVLGNENNMAGDYSGVNATRTNAGRYPEAYASLLNECAAMIHELDPDHPVAVGNIGSHLVDVYNTHAPELDILGLNAYYGSTGFGVLWEETKRMMDRPVLITEYGCDAYHEGVGINEEGQRDYLEGCYRDIIFNTAGGEFTGNAIGGSIFQWVDEWWKDTHSGDPEGKHEIRATFPMPFPDNRSHEEWLGILGQGSGKHSPFERVQRQAYDYYKSVWN